MRHFLTVTAVVCLSIFSPSLRADDGSTTQVSTNITVAPLPDPVSSMKRFRIPTGFKIEIFAAEPLLANPVSFSIDERGRFFVAETYRHGAVAQNPPVFNGVLDIRSHLAWLDEDLACRTVDDRIALLRRRLGADSSKLEVASERVRLIEDLDGDGKADVSSIYADHFRGIADGIGAGVLARQGSVYYTCIPNLWLLRDDASGKTSTRETLHSGYGVHISFLGHDLHGLRIGPDGRLYFSVGDRGFNVKTKEGRTLALPDEGAVLRCELDGSNLEIFARGLRNPQELAFDQYGNLFTGDNNSDGGDRARWVYVVEGGDSGWRIGYQHIHTAPRRGPWNAEKMWFPAVEGQPAYIVPPVLNLGYGPSGCTFYPGTGMPARYANHFFLCDFRGAASSAIHTFAMHPKGASFEMVEYEQFVSDCLPTDIEFGPDGGIYFSDWIQTWNQTGAGRIFHLTDPAAMADPLTARTKKLLGEGMKSRPREELFELLSYPDMRIRQEAQFEIVGRGGRAEADLANVALRGTNELARLHALWGIAQARRLAVARKESSTFALNELGSLLKNSSPEIRAQAAKFFGETRVNEMAGFLVELTADPNPRVAFHATVALGKMTRGRRAVSSPDRAARLAAIVKLLETNADRDPVLRHAGIVALADIETSRDWDALLQHNSAWVRLAACVALRRLKSASVASLLNDKDPRVALEAARAIYDEPLGPGMKSLAALISNAASDNEPLLHRVLNAQGWIGGADNAKALSDYASNQKNVKQGRLEAIQILGEWMMNPRRDRVHGNWRIMPKRSRDTALAAFSGLASKIIDEKDQDLAIAIINAARQLDYRAVEPDLAKIAGDSGRGADLRIAALDALAAWKSSLLAGLLNQSVNEPNEQVRGEINQILASIDPARALAPLKSALTSSGIRERQNAFRALKTMPSADADGVIVDELKKLLAGLLPREIHLDLLEAAANRPDPRIIDQLKRFEAARPATQLAPFRESLVGGNAEAGRKIFYERAEVSCLKCHKMHGEGGEVGPELGGIGKKQSREYLLESILWPNNKIAPGYETVTVTLRDGTSYSGPLKSETDTDVSVNAGEDGLVKIQKSQIKTRERGISGMPEEFRQILTKQDLRDLVEFLANQ
jgi:quinoprotein glucose dehydrogenase